MKLTRFIHEWYHKESHLRFFTFPMFHIGTKQYYKTISQMISEYNCILAEGVPLKAKNVGNYRKFARKMELYSQVDSLEIPDDMPVHLLDMDGVRFRTEFRKLPLREKFKFWKIDMALSKLNKISKDQIYEVFVRKLSYPEYCKMRFIDPKRHVAFKHKNKSELDLLIENTRNQSMQEKLQAFIEENLSRPFSYQTGIISGDGHMPHIYETLFENGFHWKLVKEICIL